MALARDTTKAMRYARLVYAANTFRADKQRTSINIGVHLFSVEKLHAGSKESFENGVARSLPRMRIISQK